MNYYRQRFKTLKERFFEKVSKYGEFPSSCPELGRCWKWNATKTKLGYGQFWIRENQSNPGAHRISWIIHNGEIAGDLFVCHKCDNPECTNPDHLFLGTSADNMTDKTRKGRQAKGKAKNPEKWIRGASHYRSVVSEKEVLRIKKLHFIEGIRPCKIIKLLKIKRHLVYQILSGKTWRHITLDS